jgi:hypothetical protein
VSARFDLSQRLFLDLAPGDAITAEAVLAFATLAYFAAGLVDVDPKELTLGHLVRHLRQREPQHPLRRSSDLPLRHQASCGCALCATRRRRVNA